ASCAAVGDFLVTVLSSPAARLSMSAVWISIPPPTRFESQLRCGTIAGASLSTRTFAFFAFRSRASAVYEGAISTSTNCAPTASAVSASTLRLNAIMPPKAVVGSVASALRYASNGVAATATPQGLAWLTSTQAVSLNVLTHSQAASVGDVVVRELLALQLTRCGDRPAARRLVTVERGLLVRIFAVTQVLQLRTLPVEPVGERPPRARFVARRQIVADGAVVGS